MTLRVHERTRIVDEARYDLTKRVLDWQTQQEDLTLWEGIKVLSDVFGDAIGNLAKYEIRYERHGTHEKRGDEA
jgi:hypothetical protein